MEPVAVFLLGLVVIVVMASGPWISGVLGLILNERDPDNDEETLLEAGADWFFRGMIGTPIFAIIVLIVGISLLH